VTRLILLILAALLTPTAAAAQSRQASATLTVESPLTVATSAPVRLKTTVLTNGAEGAAVVEADAPTVIMVGGDPDRVYRVRIPTDGGAAPAFSIVSDNGGDISDSGVSRLDGEGRDRLHITRLASPQAVSQDVASFPLSIVYE
jgi:hypothetical protein